MSNKVRPNVVDAVEGFVYYARSPTRPNAYCVFFDTNGEDVVVLDALSQEQAIDMHRKLRDAILKAIEEVEL